MEDVFRFSFARPAFVEEDATVVVLARTTKLQSELSAARSTDNGRAKMIAIAQQYATPKVPRDYSDLKLGPKWAELAGAVTGAESPTTEQLIAKIQAIFGKAPAGLSDDAAFIADDNEAADSIVLVKMLAAEQPAGFGVMPTVVRLGELVRSLARDAVVSAAAVATWTITVPPKVFPLPSVSPKGTGTAPPPSTQIPDLKNRIAATQAALEEVMSVEATTATVEDTFTAAPPAVLARSATGAAPGPSDLPTSLRRADAFAFTPTAVASLTDATSAVLKARSLDASKLSVDRIANSLARAVNADARQLAVLSPPPRQYIHLVGTTPIPVGPMPASPPNTLNSGIAWAVPTSHGTIKSVGVSDLLVVKQQLKRYERSDIAHVENVMKSESMKREHVTSTTTEEFSLTQTTSKTETEQDLESTDRFEMSRQVTDTLNEAASMQAGLTMSGSYGPSVNFTSSVQGSVQEQKSEATTTATKYSQDVTQKTAKKVSEEVMQQHSLKVTTNVTDTATHGFDNTTGDEHVVGIYQWLDKVYEAQVYNYGLRALFDFMVSEPAALTIAAMKGQFAQATELRKPADFAVTPMMIDETNYAGYLLEWQASGATPPPEPYVTVTKTFKGGPDDPNSPSRGSYVDVADVALPDGYRAVYVTASRLFNIWDPPPAETYIDVIVGGTGKKMLNNAGWTWNASLAGEVGSVAIAIKTVNTSVYAVEIELRCERTTRAMDKWRHEVYNILLAAYQKQLSDYENKLAALQARVGVEISGRNPIANRMIEMTELKRACIAILTAQNFTGFGSTVAGANNLPDLDFAKQEAEGPYIRFFEQAFEWENLTYVFYPYFWGDRSTWLERINYDDVDPTFAAFLKAGSARVVAPVRPGFACAIDHFLQTGQIWDGGVLPAIGQPLYVPIIEELRETLGAPGDEVPQGEAWEVRVATSLVLLRPDASLPVWTKNEDGSWTES